MTLEELREKIEDTLIGQPLSSRELIEELVQTPGPTKYDVIAALRSLQMAGRLIEIKGKLYLQRGF